MSERPKVQHSKCCVVSQPPWVQIPALPPLPPGPNGAGRFCYAWMVCGRVRVCACWGRAAWCARGRRATWLMVCPWAAARPRAVRAASFARRVVSKPGQAPQASRRPPIGRGCLCVARPGPAAHGRRSLASGALQTCGAWRADGWFGASARCPASLAASKCALSSVSHAIPWRLWFVAL